MPNPSMIERDEPVAPEVMDSITSDLMIKELARLEFACQEAEACVAETAQLHKEAVAELKEKTAELRSYVKSLTVKMPLFNAPGEDGAEVELPEDGMNPLHVGWRILGLSGLIYRHLRAAGINTIGDYVEYLKHDPDREIEGLTDEHRKKISEKLEEFWQRYNARQ